MTGKTKCPLIVSEVPPHHFPGMAGVLVLVCREETMIELELSALALSAAATIGYFVIWCVAGDLTH
jgi:hypothetical protein